MAKAEKIKNVSLILGDDGNPLRIDFGGNPHPCTPEFYDPDVQLAQMRACGIATQAISIAPRLFFYEVPADWNAVFCRLCNREILARCEAYPGSFLPVGSLPMQDVSLAVAEVDDLAAKGVKMLQIGTTVAGKCLDDECFLPLYRAVAKHRMVLMLHPLIQNLDFQTKRYHLSNVVGNPYQTTAAAGNLIASGIFDEIPELQVLLVHGGGFLPYQIGRMDHAWEARRQREYRCQFPPSEYLARNLLFDGLLFEDPILKFLIRQAGPDRVLFGTDYPYDMCQMRPSAGSLSPEESAAITRENAKRILGLD